MVRAGTAYQIRYSSLSRSLITDWRAIGRVLEILAFLALGEASFFAFPAVMHMPRIPRISVRSTPNPVAPRPVICAPTTEWDMRSCVVETVAGEPLEAPRLVVSKPIDLLRTRDERLGVLGLLNHGLIKVMA